MDSFGEVPRVTAEAGATARKAFEQAELPEVERIVIALRQGWYEGMNPEPLEWRQIGELLAESGYGYYTPDELCEIYLEALDYEEDAEVDEVLDLTVFDDESAAQWPDDLPPSRVDTRLQRAEQEPVSPIDDEQMRFYADMLAVRYQGGDEMRHQLHAEAVRALAEASNPSLAVVKRAMLAYLAGKKEPVVDRPLAPERQQQIDAVLPPSPKAENVSPEVHQRMVWICAWHLAEGKDQPLLGVDRWKRSRRD